MKHKRSHSQMPAKSQLQPVGSNLKKSQQPTNFSSVSPVRRERSRRHLNVQQYLEEKGLQLSSRGPPHPIQQASNIKVHRLEHKDGSLPPIINNPKNPSLASEHQSPGQSKKNPQSRPKIRSKAVQQAKDFVIRRRQAVQNQIVSARQIHEGRGKLISFKTIEQFVEAIKEQVKSKSVYSVLTDRSIPLSMLDIFSQTYLSHEQASNTLDLVLSYMSICQSYAADSHPDPESYEVKLQQVSEKWRKIKEEVRFVNQDAFDVMQLFAEVSKSQQHKYGFSFTELSFDFDEKEASQVALVAKQLCRLDLRAFGFLSTYFLVCCYKMEKQGASLPQIQKRYEQTLKVLCGKHKPAKQIIGDDQLFERHKDQEHQELWKTEKTELSSIPENKREAKLQDFIMEQARFSKQNLNEFLGIVKESCLREGFRFKSGLKLKSKTQTKAMLRVKEKMLASKFTRITLNDYLKSESRHSLESLFTFEDRVYQTKIKETYQKIKGPIEFKVTDMLRGKCMFSDVGKINNCCQQLKDNIARNPKVELIEVDNRLRGKTNTSDLVLKILVGNVVAELQLVSYNNVAYYEFSHKLYELVRSKFFSPLTTLKNFNDDIMPDFLNQMEAILRENSHSKEQKTVEMVRGLQQGFSKLIKLLPFKVDLSPVSRSEVDVTLLTDQMVVFSKLVQFRPPHNLSINPKQIFWFTSMFINEQRSADEISQMFRQVAGTEQAASPTVAAQKQVDNIIRFFKKQYMAVRYCLSVIQMIDLTFEEKFQLLKAIQKVDIQVNPQRKGERPVYILLRLGGFCNEVSRYSDALGYLELSLEAQSKNVGTNNQMYAIILNQMGIAYRKMDEYQKGLELHEKALNIFEGLAKIDDSGCQMTLNHIGQVYTKLNKYPQAIKYFERSLTIIEKVQGMNSMVYGKVLSNIGDIYLKQGNFKEATSIFERCQKIHQMASGQMSYHYVYALEKQAQALFEQGRSPQALDAFKQVLEIRESVNGTNSAEYSFTLGNIGEVYKSLEQYTAALQYCKKSLSVKQKIYGQKGKTYIESLSDLASLYRKMEQREKSQEYYRKSKELWERNFSRDSVGYATILRDMSDLLIQQDKWKEAEQCLSQCMKIQESIVGRYSLEYANTIGRVAGVEQNKGNNEKALSYYQEALQIHKKLTGDTSSIDYAIALNDISGAYYQLHDYEQSVNFNHQSVAMLEEINPMCKELITVLNSSVNVHQKAGRPAECVPFLKKRLGIEQKLHGQESVRAGMTLYQIGKIEMQNQLYVPAINTFYQCLPILQQHQQKQPEMYASILHNIGWIYCELGHPNQSLNFYEDYIQFQTQRQAKEPLSWWGMYGDMGRSYLQLGQVQQAEHSFRRSLELKTQMFGENDSQLVPAHSNLGECLKRQENYTEALVHLQTALTIVGQTIGKNKMDYASKLMQIGQVYFAQGDLDMTLKYYKECLAIKQELKGKDAPECAITLNNIGSVCHSQQKFDEALQHFQRCLKIQEKSAGVNSIYCSYILRSMEAVFRDMGEEDQADACDLRATRIEQQQAEDS